MSRTQTAWLISALFHIALLVIAFLIHIQMEPQPIMEQLKLIEFCADPYQPGDAIKQPDTGKLPEKLDRVQVSEEFASSETALPSRQVDAKDYKFIDDDQGLDPASSNLDRDAIAKSTSDVSDKPSATASDNYLNDLLSQATSGGDRESRYLLEGEILSREILSEVVPEYPESEQRNAEVRIRFTVKPDGSVTDLIVTKKAGGAFDTVATEALSAWKFNPVTGDQDQTGSITFVFVLK